MKRFRKILVALVFGLLSFLGLTACGNDGDKIVGAQVMSGSIATTVAKGGTVDTSKMKAQIRYKEAETKTVDMSELEIVQAPDTSVVGTTTMKVKYGDYEFTVTIKVVATEADVNSISLLESQLLIDYEANRKQNPNATEIEKRDEFYDATSPLYVGDDNAFNFRLNAAGRDGANKYVGDIEKVRTNISIAKKDGNQFVALTDTERADYIEAIDTEHTTIDFTQKAANDEMVFQVVVEAANKDPMAEDNATKFTAVLHVIDGYNVYNAADLSIYDNAFGYESGEWKDIWADKKAATGMTGKTTDAIILQDNIFVTKDDVPEKFFWDAETEGNDNGYKLRMQKLQELEQTEEDLLDGTLKNSSGTGLYRRYIDNGKKFLVEGNYFKIDLSAIPTCVAEGEAVDEDGVNITKVVSKRAGTAITSYMTTFYNTTTDANAITSPTSTDIQNVRFYGNGSLNNQLDNSGSIILMKCNHINLNAYNTIQHNYYIGYFLEHGIRDNAATEGVVEGQYTGDFVIDTCKGYNSYQDLFYGYGAENVIIRDSEFKNAGGPAIIAAYHGPIKENEKVEGQHYGSYFNVINSTIEAEVVGTEAWFKNYNATPIVQQFSLLEELFSGAKGFAKTGKSIFTANSTADVKKLNMVGIIYNANMKDIGEVYAEGAIRIFKDETEYQKFLEYKEADPNADGYAADSTYGLDTNKTIYNSAKANGSIYLEAEGSGGYINNNVDKNGDTTAQGGLANVAVYTMIATAIEKAVAGELQGVPAVPASTFNSVDLSGFGTKSLADQRIALCNMLDALNAVPSLGAPMVAGIVEAAAEQFSNPGITDLNSLKYAIVNVFPTLTNVSFSEGTHLNIYLNLGMCAMIGLTNVTPAQN